MPDSYRPVQRVWSSAEFNAFLNENAFPSRGDDSCVLELRPEGALRPATDGAIAAWLEKHILRQQAGK